LAGFCADIHHTEGGGILNPVQTADGIKQPTFKWVGDDLNIGRIGGGVAGIHIARDNKICPANHTHCKNADGYRSNDECGTGSITPQVCNDFAPARSDED
jgi:hypothetical protein